MGTVSGPQVEQAITPTPAEKITETITNGVITLTMAAAGVYLATNGQVGIGATILGGIVAHYFTGANGKSTTNGLLAAAQAVGRMMAPTKPAGS